MFDEKVIKLEVGDWKLEVARSGPKFEIQSACGAKIDFGLQCLFRIAWHYFGLRSTDF